MDYTVQQFAQILRKQYPTIAPTMSDDDVVNTFISKNPTYKNRVETAAPTQVGEAVKSGNILTDIGNAASGLLKNSAEFVAKRPLTMVGDIAAYSADIAKSAVRQTGEMITGGMQGVGQVFNAGLNTMGMKTPEANKYVEQLGNANDAIRNASQLKATTLPQPLADIAGAIATWWIPGGAIAKSARFATGALEAANIVAKGGKAAKLATLGLEAIGFGGLGSATTSGGEEERKDAFVQNVVGTLLFSGAAKGVELLGGAIKYGGEAMKKSVIAPKGNAGNISMKRYNKGVQYAETGTAATAEDTSRFVVDYMENKGFSVKGVVSEFNKNIAEMLKLSATRDDLMKAADKSYGIVDLTDMKPAFEAKKIQYSTNASIMGESMNAFDFVWSDFMNKSKTILGTDGPPRILPSSIEALKKSVAKVYSNIGSGKSVTDVKAAQKWIFDFLLSKQNQVSPEVVGVNKELQRFIIAQNGIGQKVGKEVDFLGNAINETLIAAGVDFNAPTLQVAGLSRAMLTVPSFRNGAADLMYSGGKLLKGLGKALDPTTAFGEVSDFVKKNPTMGVAIKSVINNSDSPEAAAKMLFKTGDQIRSGKIDSKLLSAPPASLPSGYGEPYVPGPKTPRLQQSIPGIGTPQTNERSVGKTPSVAKP